MTDISTTSAAPTPAPDAADPFALWVSGGASGLAEEILDLWACGCSAWGDYVTRLTGAVTPAAWLDANTRLMTESLDLCTRATALRLRHAGVRQPLLTDAL